MPVKIGFDNAKYLEEQTAAILERAARFDGKLYLEFGGKLLYDYHASRVLPGFDPNVKMHLLRNLKDKADIILCIYAGDIERKKVRADFGITYDADALKLIDDLRTWQLEVTAVVITRFEARPAVLHFKNKLERRGICVVPHHFTKGYPLNVEQIVSDEGYGANPYVETRNPLVVVTGPGPGSGKLATCLGQLYHEHKRGKKAGYAKFETFPIWNLPLKHPVNIAYEAATVDLEDVNMIDPFHLETYGKTAVNYNRDVEAFPLLARIMERISGASPYKSPTDMGVNCAGFGIVDDEAVRAAAKAEIIRRALRLRCEYVLGMADQAARERAELLMNEVGGKAENRAVVGPARQTALDAEERGQGHDGVFCGAALELPAGEIVTGKNSSLMHAAAAVVLNAVKQLAGLPDKLHVLSPATVNSIGRLKKDILGASAVSMDLEETLIALSISATTSPTAQLAMEQLKSLAGCEMHLTHIPTPGDDAGLRRLGVNLTSDPNFATKNLFIG
jgi:uncharacterized protein (UPF0371 family)